MTKRQSNVDVFFLFRRFQVNAGVVSPRRSVYYLRLIAFPAPPQNAKATTRPLWWLLLLHRRIRRREEEEETSGRRRWASFPFHSVHHSFFLSLPRAPSLARPLLHSAEVAQGSGQRCTSLRETSSDASPVIPLLDSSRNSISLLSLFLPLFYMRVWCTSLRLVDAKGRRNPIQSIGPSIPSHHPKPSPSPSRRR